MLTYRIRYAEAGNKTQKWKLDQNPISTFKNLPYKEEETLQRLENITITIF